jgi:hypothetical protein
MRLAALAQRCGEAWRVEGRLEWAYRAVTSNKFAGVDGVARVYLITSFFNHSCAVRHLTYKTLRPYNTNKQYPPPAHPGQGARVSGSGRDGQPTAAVDPIDPTAVLCVAPVAAGEEVCLSYFGLQALAFQPRQGFLQARAAPPRTTHAPPMHHGGVLHADSAPERRLGGGRRAQERFGFCCGCALCEAGRTLPAAEAAARLDVAIEGAQPPSP